MSDILGGTRNIEYDGPESSQDYVHQLEESREEMAKETASLRNELEEVHDQLHFLRCLEAVGVDNWEGYGIAQDMYKEEYKEDEDE